MESTHEPSGVLDPYDDALDDVTESHQGVVEWLLDSLGGGSFNVPTKEVGVFENDFGDLCFVFVLDVDEGSYDGPVYFEHWVPEPERTDDGSLTDDVESAILQDVLLKHRRAREMIWSEVTGHEQ